MVVNGLVVNTEVSESEGRLAVKYSPSFLPSISRAGLSSWKKFDGGRMGGWHRTKRLTVGRLCNTFRWKSWQLQISTHQLSSTLLQSWCGPLFSPNLLYVIWKSCECLSVLCLKVNNRGPGGLSGPNSISIGWLLSQSVPSGALTQANTTNNTVFRIQTKQQ